jgi:hypothetical protein
MASAVPKADPPNQKINQRDEVALKSRLVPARMLTPSTKHVAE